MPGVEASYSASPAGDGLPNLWRYFLGWPARKPATANWGDWWNYTQLGLVYRIIHPLAPTQATLTAYRSYDLQT